MAMGSGVRKWRLVRFAWPWAIRAMIAASLLGALVAGGVHVLSYWQLMDLMLFKYTQDQTTGTFWHLVAVTGEGEMSVMAFASSQSLPFDPQGDMRWNPRTITLRLRKVE